jgi:hypothetical protein
VEGGTAKAVARVEARVTAIVRASDRASATPTQPAVKFILGPCFSACFKCTEETKGSKALLSSWVRLVHIASSVLRCLFVISFIHPFFQISSKITARQWLVPKETEAFLVTNPGGKKPQSIRFILLPSTIVTMMVLVTYQGLYKSLTTSSHWGWT